MKLTQEEYDFDVDLALKLANIVHDACPGIRHDIGIILAIAVAEHLRLLKSEQWLCLCPLHFGDCEYCSDGKCYSPLI